MTTKPLPAHGTYARANGSPGRRPACNCAPCTSKRRATKKRYRINKERGQRGIVDATPARQHLELLRSTMSWTRIIASVGCAQDTLFNIAAGRRTRISRHTHDAILAVKPSYQISGGLYVDSTGSTRRLQALQAIGHTVHAITAAMPHTSEENVRLAARGARPRIRASFAEKIHAVYSVLAKQPGDERVAERALAKGYLPPTVWDEDIDDPAADPCAESLDLTDEERVSSLTSRIGSLQRPDQMDLARLLTQRGDSAHEIARAIGVASRTVVRWRSANGWKAVA